MWFSHVNIYLYFHEMPWNCFSPCSQPFHISNETNYFTQLQFSAEGNILVNIWVRLEYDVILSLSNLKDRVLLYFPRVKHSYLSGVLCFDVNDVYPYVAYMSGVLCFDVNDVYPYVGIYERCIVFWCEWCIPICGHIWAVYCVLMWMMYTHMWAYMGSHN